MKPLHGDTVSSDSCSCVYNSESDRQSLRRLLTQGSRINRLFDGTYLPIRDSNLLDKFIKTKELYDELRKQLLSSSSVSSKTDFIPKISLMKGKPLEAAKKSSNIFTLVDKDAIVGSRKLIECCSCCNCNSKVRLHDCVQKGRKHRLPHAGGHMASGSSVISKRGTGEELRLGRRFKAKDIKSDPCTCACKLEDFIKHKLQSAMAVKNKRSKQTLSIIKRESQPPVTDKHKFIGLNNEKRRKSYHKLKRTKAHPPQYMENGEGGAKPMKKSKPSGNLNIKNQKSTERLRLAQQKIKDNFNIDRKTLQKPTLVDGSAFDKPADDQNFYLGKSPAIPRQYMEQLKEGGIKPMKKSKPSGNLRIKKPKSTEQLRLAQEKQDNFDNDRKALQTPKVVNGSAVEKPIEDQDFRIKKDSEILPRYMENIEESGTKPIKKSKPPGNLKVQKQISTEQLKPGQHKFKDNFENDRKALEIPKPVDSSAVEKSAADQDFSIIWDPNTPPQYMENIEEGGTKPIKKSKPSGTLKVTKLKSAEQKIKDYFDNDRKTLEITKPVDGAANEKLADQDFHIKKGPESPPQYMENIESGTKIVKKSKPSGNFKVNKLKSAEQKIRDNFDNDRNTLEINKPLDGSVIEKPAANQDFRIKKGPEILPQYMENTEGGTKVIKKSKPSGNLKVNKLKSAEQKIRDNFDNDRNNLEINKPLDGSVIEKPAANQEFHIKKGPEIPPQYMENIEGGTKPIRKSKPSGNLNVKKERSTEQLKPEHHKLKDHFDNDRKTLQIPEPVDISADEKPAADQDYRIKKAPAIIKNKSNVVGTDKPHNLELHQGTDHEQGNINHGRGENGNKEKDKKDVSSSSSNLSVQKRSKQNALPAKAAYKQQSTLLQKPNKKVTLTKPHINVETPKKHKEPRSIKPTIQTQKEKESGSRSLQERKILLKSASSMPLSIPTESEFRMNKQLPSGETRAKGPMKLKIRKPVKPVKAISTSLIEKNKANNLNPGQTVKVEPTLVSKNQLNKNKLTTSQIKMLRLLEPPFRYEPRRRHLDKKPYPHKEPSNQVQEEPPPHEMSHRHERPIAFKHKHIIKNIQAGSHALKRCLCSLKIKVKNTKSKVTKNLTKERSKTKGSHSLRSKGFVSPAKSVSKVSLASYDKDSKFKSLQASKCECFDKNVTKKQDTTYHVIPNKTKEEEKPISNHALECECPKTNGKQEICQHGQTCALPEKPSTPTHASENNITPKEKLETAKYQPAQTHSQIEKKLASIHAPEINTANKEKRKTKDQPSQTRMELGKTTTSMHGSKCECPETNITIKEKQATKNQLNQTYTYPENKSTSMLSKSDINITKEKLETKNKPSQTNFNQISECECPTMHSTSKEKIGTKYQSSQTNKIISPIYASACECANTIFNTDQKRGNKYKTSQTDIPPEAESLSPITTKRKSKYHPGITHTHYRKKSISHRASIKCECPTSSMIPKDKRGIQYHSAQTDAGHGKKSYHAAKCECPIINIITKEKREIKFQPGYKNPDFEPKSTSIHASKVTADLKQREKEITTLTATKIPHKPQSKTKPENVKCECEVRDKPKHIRYKSSQISNSTGKSKYTVTKHGLRRCFCTFKLGKLEKKIYVKRPTVLPYECDPYFCMPGECNPYECQVVLTKRENKKLKKHFITTAQRRQTRSNSSLTSRSVQLPKTKKIHSILVTHKSEVPIHTFKKNGKKDLSHGHIRPSFANKFLKGKFPFPTPIDEASKMKKESKMRTFDDHKMKKNVKSTHQFTPSQIKKQDMSLLLGRKLRHCLYALTLKRKDKHGTISSDGKYNISVEKNYPNKVSKSKKINNLSQLKAYEYEPYTCVPGECDHYECLENYKKSKNIRSAKDFGIVTRKIKMISKSSDTRKIGKTSEGLFVKSDFNQQKLATKQFRNIRKYSELLHLSKKSIQKYSENSLRSGVRIGSKFSFNIELSREFLNDRPKDISDNYNKTHIKELMNRSNKEHIHQSLDIKRLPRSTKISPMLRRCFCTLKLLKKDEQHRSSKSVTPFIKAKPTQVYAVSTVTVAEINSPKLLSLHDVDLSSHCVAPCYSTSYTKKALTETQKWQYFKKQSLSSAFSISAIAFESKKMQSYYRESRCKLLHISPMVQSLIKITSKETVQFESNFSCEVNYSKNLRSTRRHLRCTQSQIDSFALRRHKQKNLECENTANSKIISQIINPSQLTGIQPLLRRCYCTMNIQVASQQNPKKRHYQHNLTKLKDYECEPGVCIPYECDPYECQKLIMKRLMRKVSKMSGTEKKLKTSSSLTCMSSCPKNRKLQSNQKQRVAKTKPTGLKYQTLPRPPRTQKQAVRVGSAFSFDIEFSKNRSKPAPVPAPVVKIPRRPSTRCSNTSGPCRRTRGTKGSGVRRRSRESQSMMRQMRHRASSVSPMLKRCFCTLKLQKKGRQHKERELLVINQSTSTPPKYNEIQPTRQKPVFRTAETGQNTKIKRIYPELLPYECEPNICVPGECNPYECLELIRKRNARHTKEFGTDSMTSKISSSSSMTTRSKRTKRKTVQSRNIKPIKSRDTAVRSKPSVMSIERQVLPTRQAVRVGSSFSFNVEFYKNKTSTPHVVDRRPPKIYVDKAPKVVKKVPKRVHVIKQVRESSSQDGKPTRDTDSQIGLLKHGRSTMTSAFLKRCFCTAKLHGIKVDERSRAKHLGEPFSVLKRCFCTLKALTAQKKIDYKNNVRTEKVTPLAEKHVVKTQTCQRQHCPVLKPYECEPGICVPGLCDPYECEKLIRKRRAKEKMAGTDGPKTRSSSSFASSKTSKARMTQSKFLQKPPEKVRRSSPREIVIKERPVPLVLPSRQAVRIGSSFSFDVEFYKDKFPNYHQVQAAATAVKKSRPTKDRAHGPRPKKKKTKDIGLKERRSVCSRSCESQVAAAKTEDKALGPILKRCFCTLKLQKQKQAVKEVKKEIAMDQGTSTPVVKEVPTLRTRSIMTANKQKVLPYKLEPYECEPGVCVPGECDPYECEKRIKKRLMNRASGTLTRHRQTRSTNVKKVRRRHRDGGSQAAVRCRPSKCRKVRQRVRLPESISTVVARPSRQAVKIGSSFSFNVEFYKDRSRGNSISSSQMMQYATYEKPRRTGSRSTEWRSISSRNKRAQRTRAVRNMDSQVLARKMRSTMTGVGPFLKRCFCTLQLHKSQNDRRPFDAVTVATKTVKSKIVQPTAEGVNVKKSKHSEKQAPHSEKEAPHSEKHASHIEKQTSHSEKQTSHSEKQTSHSEKQASHSQKQASHSQKQASHSQKQASHSQKQASHSEKQASHSEKQASHSEKQASQSEKQASQSEKQASHSEKSASHNEKQASHSKKQTLHTQKKSLSSQKQTLHTQKQTLHSEKHAQFYRRKLEPYECEPGVCIPGQCDPYECEKRIKKRMLSKQSSTEQPRGRSVSSSIAESTQSKPKGTQRRAYTPTQKKVRTGRGDDHVPVTEEDSYDTSSDRQVVRIGSSFSFNIEFYKDKTPQLPSHREVSKIIKKSIKNTETGPKRTKSMSSYSKKTRLRDCQSQSDCVKTDCKASCAPLLKRCFCTLKLQKMGKYQEQTKIKTEPTTRSMGTRTPVRKKVEIQPVARDIGTKTKKYRHILEPYECEPGVCVPGECDPYECEKRIKLRNMKHFGTGTTPASMKSMASLTSKSRGTKAMGTKLLKEKRDRKRIPSTEKTYKVKRHSRAMESVNRQAVRFGSNFSFNVEFFKDRSSGHGGSYGDEVQSYYKPPSIKPAKHKSRTSSSASKRAKVKSQGSYGQERLFDHRQSQVGPTTESKASGMGPLLKRCFCTLTLQRAEVKHNLNSAATKSKSVKVETEDKATSTKKKYIPPPPSPAPVHKLEPYECEPNFCVPGECNPYECLERIKKRGIRRMSRTTGTRMKRPSQVSVSSMAAQLMPGYRCKQTQRCKEEAFSRQKVESIVEEPRFPFLRHDNTRQVVRITSNFGFNIEFFKEVIPPINEDDDYCPEKEICREKGICTDCKKSGRSKLKTKIGQHETMKPDAHSQQSQSVQVKTEDKSSAVAILKRCFCTAKLHKKNPRSVTVCRVEEIKPFPCFGPREHWVQYQMAYNDTKKPAKVTALNNRKTQSSKLETIMSYSASKFNKVKSKTDGACCSTCNCNRKNCQKRGRSGVNSKGSYNPNKTCCSTCQCKRKFRQIYGPADLTTAKRVTIKKSIILQQQTAEMLEANSSTLKKMMCRCKDLFTKRTNQQNNDDNFGEGHIKPVQTKIKHIKQSPTDVVKFSKSERRPNCSCARRDVIGELKKTASLKVANVTETGVHHTKKKYSRFQSGDADQGHSSINKSQKFGINFVKKTCAHCHAQFKQPISINKQVHFSLSPEENGAEHVEIMEQEKKKSVSLLFKSSKYMDTENPKCLRLCSCCGGLKRNKNPETLNQKLILQESSNEHKSSCPCCVCRANKTTTKTFGTKLVKLGIKQGVKAVVKPGVRSGVKPEEKPEVKPGVNPGVKPGVKPEVKPGVKPASRSKIGRCVCGSATCKRETEKRAKALKLQLEKRKTKTCVCGTKICARESKKEAKAKKAGIKLHKKKKQAEKKRALEAKELEKMYKLEDDEIKRRRKLNDKYMMKQLKKYKDTSDVLLLAESVLDIGHLGITSARDILRNTFRAVFNPKRTYKNIRMFVRDPMRLWKKFQDAAADGPGIATLKRLKMRCQAMKCVQEKKEKLEEHPATNFIIHSKDRDPKRRLRPRRPRVRRRQDPSFGCSPYMLSLRQRPWLAVYYKCSWFYPHCLSLLQVWRQFTDVLLFLLAVVVWCPCIAGMEICRALMCCFMCTG